MAEHTSPKPGRWTYTLDPNSDTTDCQWFDTKEEAIAACKLDLRGIWSDEARAYVVRCDKVIDYEMASRNLARMLVTDMDNGTADERITEDEELGCDGSILSKVPRIAEVTLRDFLAGWLKQHGLVPMVGWWQYNETEEVNRE